MQTLDPALAELGQAFGDSLGRLGPVLFEEDSSSSTIYNFIL